MVLQYVQTYGRISRADAAELCHLSPPQAYRLLQRLVKSGKLIQRGQKKGAWYGLGA
jgi:ATP-dependent DNA helicase RecG